MLPLMLTTIVSTVMAVSPVTLSVTFPDRSNPNFYHVMSCNGAMRAPTKSVAAKSVAAVKQGRVVFRCAGPMTTTIQRSPLEPKYIADSRWSWVFEDASGHVLLTGDDARRMTPTRGDVRLYVREGYLEP